MAKPRNGRSVFAVNAAVTVLVVVLLAALALVVSPPAPPSLSAFAPTPQRPITEAPQTQSAASGEGEGGSCAQGQEGCTATSTTTTTTTIAESITTPTLDPTIGAPPGLQCYTWPDGSVTQTFDPQSPPCVSTWDYETGNGGATATGVSANTIRVAVDTENPDLVAALQRFFNNHYQFYGRQIEFVLIDVPKSPEEQNAAAAEAAELGVFAAVLPPASGAVTADHTTYLHRLAASGIVSSVPLPGLATSSDLADLHPYAWAYAPPIDVVQQNLADMLCRQLVPGKATHSGGFAGTTRKFVAFFTQPERNAGRTYPDEWLKAGLARCNTEYRRVEVPSHGDTVDDDLERARLMGELRDQEYTSAILFEKRDANYAIMTSASQSGYQPEWIVPGLFDQQSELNWRTQPPIPPEQLRSVFGLASWNRNLPPTQNVARRAARDGGAAGQILDGDYYGWALLAAGIQAAGPNLTAESFAAGLGSLRFPNPGAAGPDLWQATVGFQTGDHTMIDDFAQVWWNNTTSTYAGGMETRSNGGWCYVGGGTRWRLGAWPAGDPFPAPDTAC